MNPLQIVKVIFGLRGWLNNKKTGLGLFGILAAIVIESVIGVDIPGFDPAALGIPPLDGQNILTWGLGALTSGGVLHKIFKMAQSADGEAPTLSPSATDWGSGHPGHGAN